MGNWNITIIGLGAHHNPGDSNYVKDANRMAERFVADLQRAGQTIKGATFTYGSEDDLAERATELLRREAARSDG